jgi:hypothetical protein
LGLLHVSRPEAARLLQAGAWLCQLGERPAPDACIAGAVIAMRGAGGGLALAQVLGAQAALDAAGAVGSAQSSRTGMISCP